MVFVKRFMQFWALAPVYRAQLALVLIAIQAPVHAADYDSWFKDESIFAMVPPEVARNIARNNGARLFDLPLADKP